MAQLIFPGIITRNQEELDRMLEKLKNLVKAVHLDVMDGKFVPNTSLNFNLKLKKDFSYQAHLVVKNPEKWFEKYKKIVKTVFFHFEALEKGEIASLIKKIKKEKKKAGLALNPETKVEKIKPYLKLLDYVLVLTVHPGRYGAPFLPVNLKKNFPNQKIKQKNKNYGGWRDESSNH